MAIAKRIIMNENENTATDYIPYDPVSGTEYWAYVNGIRIPHWVQENGHPLTKAKDPTSEYQTGLSGGYTSNGYTYYCSTHNSYVAYGIAKAFNGILNSNYSWATANNDTAPWLAIKLPYALKNIKVTLYNRVWTVLINGPVAGTIYGFDSIDGSQTKLIDFSGLDGATSGGSSVIDCKNYNNAYQYIMIKFTSWYNMTGDKYGSNYTGQKYLAVGEVVIDGKKAV